MSTTTLPALPTLSSDEGYSAYMAQIRRFPMLDAQEEQTLAKAYAATGDVNAAHTLVTSHLRLVAKIAYQFKGYGLSLMDLIAEGTVGLMQAVKKFDVEKGFRLSTYAMWWIKASIQEFVLKSWSLVKIGTSATQKTLFFNLRKLKNRIMGVDNGNLHPEHISEIATELDVNEQDVRDMEMRLSGGDQSLNAPLTLDGESGEWIDFVEDDSTGHDLVIAENQEIDQRREMLANAMQQLNEREQDIITSRKITEPALTLEDLSQKYGVSRERIRQIEERAMQKLQQFVVA